MQIWIVLNMDTEIVPQNTAERVSQFKHAGLTNMLAPYTITLSYQFLHALFFQGLHKTFPYVVQSDESSEVSDLDWTMRYLGLQYISYVQSIRQAKPNVKCTGYFLIKIVKSTYLKYIAISNTSVRHISQDKYQTGLFQMSYYAENREVAPGPGEQGRWNYTSWEQSFNFGR